MTVTLFQLFPATGQTAIVQPLMDNMNYAVCPYVYGQPVIIQGYKLPPRQTFMVTLTVLPLGGLPFGGDPVILSIRVTTDTNGSFCTAPQNAFGGYYPQNPGALGTFVRLEVWDSFRNAVVRTDYPFVMQDVPVPIPMCVVNLPC